MKHLRYLSGLFLVPILLGCNATTQEEPTPSVPRSNIYVHYQMEGLGVEGYMLEVKTYVHTKPDSLIDHLAFSRLGNWEKDILLPLDKKTDVSAAFVILPCAGVARSMPVGAKLRVDLILDGKVLKSKSFQATAAAPIPPEVNTATLTCLER